MSKVEVLLKKMRDREEKIKLAKSRFNEIKEIERGFLEDIVGDDDNIVQEPAEFEACVRNGGRVRTKDMGDGKFMRICFIGGKSFAGEVQTKKEGQDITMDNGRQVKEDKFMPEKNLVMTESLKEKDFRINTRIIEKKIDEGQRTVVAGILEGDSLSANKRFYPMSVVESVKESLVGRKALIGHDTDSPEDIVATIVNSAMSGKRLIGSFKFGTDEKSEMMFRKVKDGLVDSVSIRASGETKPGKINNEEVDIVQKLDIWSVDFVVEGGVESAKVMQVFENSPTIVLKESNKEEEMDEATKQKLAEAEVNVSKLKEMEEANKKLAEDKAKLEEEKKKAELEAYKVQKLSTIEDKEIRADVAENLSGDTKEAIDSSFNKLKKLAEGVAKKAGSKIKLEPVKEGSEGDFKTLDEVFESSNVKKEEKVELLHALMAGK